MSSGLRPSVGTGRAFSGVLIRSRSSWLGSSRTGRPGGTAAPSRYHAPPLAGPILGAVRPPEPERRRRQAFRRIAFLGLVGLLATAVGAPQAAVTPVSSAVLTAGVQETVLPNGLTVLIKEVR